MYSVELYPSKMQNITKDKWQQFRCFAPHNFIYPLNFRRHFFFISINHNNIILLGNINS